jgi:hypothetical protein
MGVQLELPDTGYALAACQCPAKAGPTCISQRHPGEEPLAPSSEAADLRAGCGQTRTSISSILSRHICERDLPASLESTEFRPTELFESTDVCEGPRHRSAPHTRELRLPIDQ